MRSTPLIAMLLLGLSGQALAQANPHLDKAREQIAELYFEEALVSLEKAIQLGVSDIEQTAEIYRLMAENAATLDQPGAAKSNFIKFLSIEPDGKLQDGLSPKITDPFDAAKKVVGDRGIELKHAVKSQDPPKLLLVVVRDPANLVAAAHASYRQGGGQDKSTLAPGKGEINVELPPGTTQVVLSAVDEYGNKLGSIGSSEDPIVLKAGAGIPIGNGDGDKPPGGDGFNGWWMVSGGVTVGLAAAGVVAGLSARSKVSDIEAAIADSENLEFATDVKPLEDKAKRHALYANIAFGAAGVGAIATVILFYTSRDSGEEKRPATVVAPTVGSDGVGVSATLRF
jgi:hypothetical protein